MEYRILCTRQFNIHIYGRIMKNIIIILFVVFAITQIGKVTTKVKYGTDRITTKIK